MTSWAAGSPWRDNAKHGSVSIEHAPPRIGERLWRPCWRWRATICGSHCRSSSVHTTFSPKSSSAARSGTAQQGSQAPRRNCGHIEPTRRGSAPVRCRHRDPSSARAARCGPQSPGVRILRCRAVERGRASHPPGQRCRLQQHSLLSGILRNLIRNDRLYASWRSRAGDLPAARYRGAHRGARQRLSAFRRRNRADLQTFHRIDQTRRRPGTRLFIVQHAADFSDTGRRSVGDRPAAPALPSCAVRLCQRRRQWRLTLNADTSA